MSARRWFVLLAFVLFSLVLSCGWIVWIVVVAPPGQAMGRVGIAGILQLLEIALAFGLLRLSDFAHTWAVRLYIAKVVIAGALGVGRLLAGVSAAEVLVVTVPVCAFYVAFVLFLRASAEFFD